MADPAVDRSPSGQVPGATPAAPSQNALAAFSRTLLARALRAAGRLLAFALAARLFSLDEVGTFAFWLAVGTFAAIASDLGLSEHLMRALPGAGERSHELVRAAIRARGAALLPASILGALIGALMGGVPEPGAAGAFAFGLAVGVADFVAAIRRGQGWFGLEAIESGLVAGAGLGAAGLAAALGGGFAGFQLALGAASLAAALWRLGLARGTPHRSERGAAMSATDVAKEARWLWAKAVMGWGFLDATVLLLGALSDSVQVALFAGAARLVGLMTQPLIALTWMFTPVLAHASRLGRDHLDEAARRLNQMGLAAVPGALALCILFGKLGLAGFGRDYRAAEPILWLLAAGFAVHACMLSSAPLIVLERDKGAVVATLAGQLALVLTTVLSAGSFGAAGAAAGVLVGLVVPKVAMLGLYRRVELPLGGVGELATLAAVLSWCGILWQAEGWTETLALAVGAFLSGLALFTLLIRTRVFVGGR